MNGLKIYVLLCLLFKLKLMNYKYIVYNNLQLVLYWNRKFFETFIEIKDFFSIGAPTELITTFITLSFPVSNGFVKLF